MALASSGGNYSNNDGQDTLPPSEKSTAGVWGILIGVMAGNIWGRMPEVGYLLAQRQSATICNLYSALTY